MLIPLLKRDRAYTLRGLAGDLKVSCDLPVCYNSARSSPVPIRIPFAMMNRKESNVKPTTVDARIRANQENKEYGYSCS